MPVSNEPQPGFFARLGRVVTRIRMIVSNLLFFGLLVFLLVVVFSNVPAPVVPDGGALVLDPEGTIVEQRSPIDPIQQWLSPRTVVPETELDELLDALKHGADDDRVAMAVLKLDDLQYVSTVHANTIGEALDRFRASGKPVIAYGAFYDQQPYLMAAHADAIYMHPFGQVLLPGYAINQLYYKGILDKLKVNVHVFRAGRYKEFVEPYLRADMSSDAREANTELVDTLWRGYAATVTSQRRLEPERFARYTRSYDAAVEETDGDFARLAVEYHLVDELLTPDEARSRIADSVGYDDSGDFNGIGFRDYLRAVDGAPSAPRGDRQIAVITAEGPVMMGDQGDGAIAADELIGMIRKVRREDAVHALVLRLDTPGGSAFASELIRQELELLQLAGKPVVVSMGPVAASGGYWIASTADAIFADPATLTGSIGVFGILPTFEDGLAEVGVTSDGVSSSDMTVVDPLRGLSEQAASVLQTGTDHTYRRFTSLVARGRHLSPERVEEIAQGRVWLGSRALELGLVDSLGGLPAAIDKAGELAELEDYSVYRIKRPLSPGEILLRQIAGSLSLSESASGVIARWVGRSALPPVIRDLGNAIRWLGSLDDPQHNYALCLACALTESGR